MAGCWVSGCPGRRHSSSVVSIGGVCPFAKTFSRPLSAHRFWVSGECVKAQEEGSFSDSFLGSSTRVARERHLPIAEGFGVLFNGHLSMRILLKVRIAEYQLEIQTPRTIPRQNGTIEGNT